MCTILSSGMNEIETEPLVSPSSQSFPYGSIDLDEVAEYEKELQNLSSSTSFKWKSLCRIEVAAFLKSLELGLHTVARTNLMIAKVCTVDLNLGDDICSDIHNHSKDEVMVQEKVNTLHLYSQVLADSPA